MSRQQLAQDIAAGLAGWHQLQHVQKLGDLSGEDTARFLIAQVVNAQGRYQPATSQLPNNWGSTKKRIDIAIKPTSKVAVNWYGAIEIKWPGSSFDPHQIRLTIVQDIVRLSFVETANLNAHFLVLGGTEAAMTVLFTTPHPGAADREARRTDFEMLLSRDLADPKRKLLHSQWSSTFSEAGQRVPDTLFDGFDGRIKTELLAAECSKVGTEQVGRVFVWQCNRTRGTAEDA